MIGRISAGLIVAFWVGMMVALVRLEFFPEPFGVGEVPPEVVLRRVFQHEEDTRLNVFYQGSGIGFCKVEITPLLDPAFVAPTNGVAATRPPAVTGYNVLSELTLTLPLLGAPTRFRVVGLSLFDPAYQLQSFHLKAALGEGRFEVRGDSVSNQLAVEYEFGDLKERRVFEFGQVSGAGLASALGVPGLANLSGFAGAGLPGSPGGAGENLQTRTAIYLSELRVGNASLRAYRVESRLDQNIWARLWISERGEILKVETSIGLTMLADVLSDQSLSFGARSRAADEHDFH